VSSDISVTVGGVTLPVYAVTFDQLITLKGTGTRSTSLQNHSRCCALRTANAAGKCLEFVVCATDPEEPPVPSRRRVDDAAANGAGAAASTSPTFTTLKEILQVRLLKNCVLRLYLRLTIAVETASFCL